MGLLDVARQAEQMQMSKDANRSRHGMLNDDTPLRRAQYGGMYGSLMQDPADKARMEAQMMEDTMAMMPMAGMTTYHGSPHIFDKFRMDKIGTGEGHQAYGHGLYLAENPNVAKEYQKKFSHHSQALDREALREYFKPGNIVDGYGGKDRVIKFNEWEGKPPYTFGGWGVDVKAVEKKGEEWVDSGRLRSHATLPSPQNYEKVTGKKAAHLYKVDLPDEQIAKMLDWDKPLGEQSKYVRKILKKEGYDRKRLYDKTPNTWGSDVYQNMMNNLDQRKGLGKRGSSMATAEELKRIGIPGIKYLDAVSRSAEQKTRNFVVFDENIPQILERNQQPIGGLLGK